MKRHDKKLRTGGADVPIERCLRKRPDAVRLIRAIEARSLLHDRRRLPGLHTGRDCAQRADGSENGHLRSCRRTSRRRSSAVDSAGVGVWRSPREMRTRGLEAMWRPDRRSLHTGCKLWSDWDARLKPGRCTTGAGRTEDGTVHQDSENWHLPSCRRTSRRNEAFGMKFAAQVPEPSQPKGASEAARQRPFRVEPSAGNRWRRKSRENTARELQPGHPKLQMGTK
jgi:hypothetical protein